MFALQDRMLEEWVAEQVEFYRITARRAGPAVVRQIKVFRESRPANVVSGTCKNEIKRARCTRAKYL